MNHALILGAVLLGGSRLAQAADGVPPQRPIVGALEGEARLAPRAAGQVLLTELNCTACHASSDPGQAPKGGPDLSQAGGRIHPGHLRQFIANPSATKPGTTMPDVLAHLPEAERQETANALAHYLSTLGRETLEFERPAPDAIERGGKMYHAVGCVACHSPQIPLAGSVPLGPLPEKYSLAGLTSFLEDPLAVRRGGRMPDFRLDHFEALDIASYLLRDQSARMEISAPDRQLAERGRVLFARHRCHACHDVVDRRAPTTAVPVMALKQVRPDQGCLAETPGPWPRYPLATDQRVALRAALAPASPRPQPEEALSIILTRLHCLACHQRGDLGGVPPQRAPFFTGTEENLGDQGRLPPPLTGVGAKLQRDWLREVVVHGASVRPYLRTRMPRFGATNTEGLVELFKQQDRLPVATFERVRESDKPRQVGRELAGSQRFNCVACHTFREKSAAPIRALDLASMAARLEENWFQQYLASPQQFSPLTIMPGFWPDGKSPLPDLLGGDPAKQRDALWQYLAEGPEAAEPRGLVLEPLVIPVMDEAVMLRRSYPGIGKRGIGVGYPSGLNLSFDAGQMRLGSIWTGRFVEASGVWRGQGAGNVQVLGRDTVNFPPGPALARLASASTSWPTNLTKQAEGMQFKGYSLDARQRPTFRYQFGEVTVEDRFLDVRDAAAKPHFERTLTFGGKALPADLYFRLATDRIIEERAEGGYAVGRALWLRLPAGSIVRETEQGRELILPVTTSAPMTIEYHLTSPP